jgi:hypothetical protein
MASLDLFGERLQYMVRDANTLELNDNHKRQSESKSRRSDICLTLIHSYFDSQFSVVGSVVVECGMNLSNVSAPT